MVSFCAQIHGGRTMRTVAWYAVPLYTIIILLLVTGCTQSPQTCPTPVPVDKSNIEQLALDDDLPFSLPMEDMSNNFVTNAAIFASHGATSRGPEYHAAEDTFRPAGTPVYAIADGKISYAGPMGGYGLLIIIDHPQANLYSLYGHLSPSMWHLKSGWVEKGDLLAYLGEAHENGGSRENPLRTHLHLGLRAGQKSDYPARGQWRWMAGWIAPCPQDLGWLQPSLVISRQEIPEGGFQAPTGNFLNKWAVELIMGGIYLVGAVSMLIFGLKKEKPYLMMFSAAVLIAAGVYFFTRGWKMSYLMFISGISLAGAGLWILIRRYRDRIESLIQDN
jgi:hypothetical protein